MGYSIVTPSEHQGLWIGSLGSQSWVPRLDQCGEKSGSWEVGISHVGQVASGLVSVGTSQLVGDFLSCFRAVLPTRRPVLDPAGICFLQLSHSPPTALVPCSIRANL